MYEFALALFDAVGEFLAAALRAIGIVGRSRRRAGIEADLKLLRDLESYPQFGKDTTVYKTLSEHIEREIRSLVALDVKVSQRRIEWGEVAGDIVVIGGLGFLTYYLSRNGFSWYSLIPAFFAIGGLGSLKDAVGTRSQESSTPQNADKAVDGS